MVTFSQPILLLGFNRPNETMKILNRIGLVKPTKLYFACDGPRLNNEEDNELCAEVRSIVNKVDWDCEINTLFRQDNLGCKKAISQAIDWFFKHEEKGIIIEDDCLVDISFFHYCDELLELYSNDDRIMCISGCNFVSNLIKIDSSYYFSNYPLIWGWATWKRAWKHYNVNLDYQSDNSLKVFLKNLKYLDFIDRLYWFQLFSKVKSNNIDTWDYQWVYAIWKNKGLTCIPNKNLVSNIGFSKESFNTKDVNSNLSNMDISGIELPLIKPDQFLANCSADNIHSNKILIRKYKTKYLFYLRLIIFSIFNK
ncbi:MAG: hypothetical protein PHP53_03060 [Prolixibacteraceae bacterium]|nr:hypothetical protein [Prolixibacteraceae bacterium]